MSSNPLRVSSNSSCIIREAKLKFLPKRSQSLTSATPLRQFNPNLQSAVSNTITTKSNNSRNPEAVETTTEAFKGLVAVERCLLEDLTRACR